MNIKLKAALEIVGMILVCVVVVTGMRAILNMAVVAYGADNVINGIAFGLVGVAAYVCVGLLYDIRVAKLKYIETLNKMVTK